MNYAIIENNIVTNIVVVGETDAPNEESGISYLQSLGFVESKYANRVESPTPARIGDQFNYELGRFQDDPNATPAPLEDTTKEWFYNDNGRWEVRDVQEES